jgi:YesN/AraC family two-component response regulator
LRAVSKIRETKKPHSGKIFVLSDIFMPIILSDLANVNPKMIEIILSGFLRFNYAEHGAESMKNRSVSFFLMRPAKITAVYRAQKRKNAPFSARTLSSMRHKIGL